MKGYRLWWIARLLTVPSGVADAYWQFASTEDG